MSNLCHKAKLLYPKTLSFTKIWFFSKNASLFKILKAWGTKTFYFSNLIISSSGATFPLLFEPWFKFFKAINHMVFVFTHNHMASQIWPVYKEETRSDILSNQKNLAWKHEYCMLIYLRIESRNFNKIHHYSMTN